MGMLRERMNELMCSVKVSLINGRVSVTVSVVGALLGAALAFAALAGSAGISPAQEVKKPTLDGLLAHPHWVVIPPTLGWPRPAPEVENPPSVGC